MRPGSSLRRRAVGVVLAALCFATSRVKAADPDCAAPGVVYEMEVKSESDAENLRATLWSCAGGVFDVTWHGRVVDASFSLVNGTNLSITGAVDPSSSAQPSSDVGFANDSAPTITEYSGGSIFYVGDNSTLTLESMVLEGAGLESSSYSRAIRAITHATTEPINPATVNVVDCTFRNNTGYNEGDDSLYAQWSAEQAKSLSNVTAIWMS